jgi:Ring finger domain/CUE domain
MKGEVFSILSSLATCGGFTLLLQRLFAYSLFIKPAETNWALAFFSITICLFAFTSMYFLIMSFVDPSPEDLKEARSRAFDFSMVKCLIVLLISSSFQFSLVTMVLGFHFVNLSINLANFLIRKRLDAYLAPHNIQNVEMMVKARKNLFFLLNILLFCFGTIYVVVSTFSISQLGIYLLADLLCASFYALHTLTRAGVFLYDYSYCSNCWDFAPDALGHAEVFEILSIIVSIIHYLHVWYIKGVAFSIVDGLILYHVRGAFGALSMRLDRLRRFRALNTRLDVTFRSATLKELEANEENVDENDPDSRFKECSICLESMRETGGKVLPVCKHIFHRRCLRRWLLEHRDCCPMCRTGLTPELHERQQEQQNHRNDVRNTTPTPQVQVANTALDEVFVDPEVREPRARDQPFFDLRFQGNFVMPGFEIRWGEQAPLRNGGHHGPAVSDQMIQQVYDMFPHLSRPHLLQHLQRSRRIEQTIDAALSGMIPHAEHPRPAPPSVAPSTSSAPSSSSFSSVELDDDAEEELDDENEHTPLLQRVGDSTGPRRRVSRRYEELR